jgi:hypothetical protein
MARGNVRPSFAQIGPRPTSFAGSVEKYDHLNIAANRFLSFAKSVFGNKKPEVVVEMEDSQLIASRFRR